MQSGIVQRGVEQVVAVPKHAVDQGRLSSHKPPDKIVADPGFLVERADIDALVTIDVVHAGRCFCAVLVPEAQAFFSVQGPLQHARIGGSRPGFRRPFAVQNRLGGAVLGALFTGITELRDAKVYGGGRLQRKVCQDFAEPHSWPELRRHKGSKTTQLT